MNKITFTSVYGDETRTVVIGSPYGGGGSFQIMETLPGFEGMFCIGDVIHTMYGWRVYSNFNNSYPKSPAELEKDIKFSRRDFTTDDKDAILDRLIEAGLIEGDLT